MTRTSSVAGGMFDPQELDARLRAREFALMTQTRGMLRVNEPSHTPTPRGHVPSRSPLAERA